MRLNLQLFGPFRAALDGETVDLRSRRSQAILAMLALAPKSAIARDTLAATIWPDRAEAQARASLRQEVSNLRSALGKDSGIVTADANYVRIDPEQLDPEFGTPEDGGFLEGFDLRSEPFEDWRRDTATQLDRYADAPDVPQVAPGPTHADIFQNPSVLVMAFVAASKDDEDQAFATGLVLDLRTSLSLWRWFPVIGPEAIGWLSERDGSLREIADSVGAAYALSGAIRRAGSRLRVTASLTEVSSGHLIWTENFDGDMSDVFEMQEAIGRAVVARVTPEIGRAETTRIQRQKPSDMSAWQLIAQSDEIDRLGGEGYGTPDSNRAQVPLIEEAIRREPDYVHAIARLSRFWFRNALLGWIDDRDMAMGKALRLAEQAVSLDPLDWEGHVYLALTLIFGKHSFGPGRFHAEEAVRLNPSAPIARHGYGCALEWLGETEETIRQKKVLFDLNPNYPARAAVLGELATCQLFSGRVEDAAATARQLRDIAPAYSRGLQRVAVVLGHAGATEEAAEALEQVIRLQPDFNETYIRNTYPYADPKHVEVILTGLRLAGWRN